MERAAQTEPDRKEEEERKRPGFFAGFLERLGLSAPRTAGQGLAVGARAGAAGQGLSAVGGLGVRQAGLFAGMLATKAGIVALVLSAVSIAAGLGTLGRGMLGAGSGGSIGRWMSRLPSKPGAAEPAAAGEAGGSSLDYMKEAAANDELLQGQAAPAEEAPAAPAFDSSIFPKPAEAEAPAAAPAPPAAPAGRASLAKLQGFAGQGSGGGGSFGRSSSGSTFSTERAARTGALAAMRRDRSMAGGAGRRSLVGSRGMRTSDALKRALKDGQSQLGSRNPTMARAGATFDGAASSIQAAPATVPQGGPGGGAQEGAASKVSPNRVLDQRDVPAPPAAKEGKETTPYKWAIYAAIGSLLLAFLLQFMAGKKKDAAQKMTGPEKLAALGMASTLHWLAAAAAGAAAAMGAILMMKYGQKMQGIMFTAAGGLLAFFNVKAAMDASAGSKDTEAAKDASLGKMGEGEEVIKENLGSKGGETLNKPRSELRGGSDDGLLEV